MTRPDLEALREAHKALTEVLNKATEERVGAKSRVDHLDRLRTAMEETLRKLDDAEAAMR